MNIKIGLPFAPAEIVKVEELLGDEIVLLQGNSVQSVYTFDVVKSHLNEKFITIDTNYSKDDCLNTAYITSVTPVKFIKMVIENIGNPNMQFDTKTYYIKLNISDTYTINYDEFDDEFYTRTINFYE